MFVIVGSTVLQNFRVLNCFLFINKILPQIDRILQVGPQLFVVAKNDAD